MRRPIYLDYGATTPVDPAVAAAMQPWLFDGFGNPHSPHRWGFEASAAIAAAREHVAALLDCAAAQVTFTGGATESVNWALKGVLAAAGPTRRRIVTLATEHSCVLATTEWLAGQGVAVTVLPVRDDGLIDLETLDAALGPDVALVSAMLVNNEIGTVQPIAEIARRAHAAGALLHCDAAQGFGKLDCTVATLGVDLLSATAHKLYGPKGVGVLYRRSGIGLAPLLHGGGQEDGRSGTLSPMLCAGFGEAARVAAARMSADAAHCTSLQGRLLSGLDADYTINGTMTARWPGNLNLSFDGVDGARLLPALRGIAVSSGSACASAGGRASHVLAALGLDAAAARSSLRIGWGRFTTPEDIDAATAELNAVVHRLRRRAA